MNENPVLALFTNLSLWTAIVAMFLAQLFKLLIEYWRTKSWRKAVLFGTGGMPSSHSALATALMVSIGMREGFGTPVFAISAVFTMIVAYDAAGVRRAAGKQAKAINLLFAKLEDQGLTLEEKLIELLGHKPIEVLAGVLLGVIVAGIACTFIP